METQNQIIQRAYKLFHQFGIKSVTMDDIAKDLGMSKKTLYKNFSNKEEIVFRIANGQVSQNECDCMEAFKNAENAIHELMLLMINLRELFRGMNPSVLYDLNKYYPKAWGVMQSHLNDFVKAMIEKNLSRGIKEGLYREDINISILARLRMEEIRLTFEPRVFEGHSMESVQVALLEHFMLGIATLKGHQLAIEYKKKSNE